MKLQLTQTFELTQKELKLLKYLCKNNWIEYRDSECYTYEQLVKEELKYNNLEWISKYRSEERFNERNGNGTLKQAEKLVELGLADYDGESWHRTLISTDLGKLLLEQNEIN